MKKSLLGILLVALLASCSLAIINEQFGPGEYSVKRTLWSFSTVGLTLTAKINKINVSNDYSTEVYMSWESERTGISDSWIEKYSDVGNNDMYIKDELGNRYDHYEVTGAAAEDVTFSYPNKKVEGTYKFPPIDANAKILTFFDDDQGKSIEIRFK